MTDSNNDLHRHMEKSSLYEEDIFVKGHSAVWGSFYDRETGTWGYACCSGLVKSKVCPNGDAKLTAESDIGRASRKESAREQQPGSGESIQELAAVEKDIRVGAELVRRFAAAALKEWQSQSGQGTAPSSGSLQRLVDKILAMELDKDVSGKIEHICRLSLSGDHLGAQKAYMDLTIGNGKWLIGGIPHVAADAKNPSQTQTNVRSRNIKEQESLLDDVALKKSLQDLKRLLSFVEARGKS